ncbi:flippase [Haloarcula litorea]|uniref:flippase n=1 Tax=Haloarcula litorea TaxID=3032579 RepID=UPI0023E89404|nr:flippase [Halomicroarcula sp. GDY20]
MNLVRSALKIFSANVVSSVLSFLAIVLFSQELGAAPLGTYYPFLALLGLLAIPADFGISAATEKRLSEGSDPGSFLSTALVLKLPPLVLIGTLIILAQTQINQYLGEDIALLLVVVLFVQEGANMSLSVLRGELRTGQTALVRILRPVGFLTVGYLLIAQGYGLIALIYGYLAGTVAMLVAGWWRVSTSFARPKISHARSLFDYGKFSVVSSLGGYFYSWMDVAILSLFVSLELTATRADIGAYENAWRVSMIVLLLGRAIATTIFPQMSKWDAEDATDRIENVLPTAMLPALLIVIPAFAGTIVLSDEILRILFGPEFTTAWLVLIILMGEKIFQAVHIMLGRSLQALDNPDLAAYATAVAITVNLVLNVVLIWQFGIAGAAVATAISFVVNTGLHTHYLNKFITVDFPVAEMLWSVAASVVMAFVLYRIQLLMTITDIVELLAVVTCGVVIYGLVLFSSETIRVRVSDALRPVVDGLT